jgi:hypothetical protein
MKISYKNYPILEKLHNGSLGLIPIFENDKDLLDNHNHIFTPMWKFHIDGFRESVSVISKAFVDASEKARPKLVGLLEDILVNDICDLSTKGTYIYGDFVYMIDYSVKKGVETQEFIFYMFDQKGIPLACYIDSAKHNINQFMYISKAMGVQNIEAEIKEWISYRASCVLMDCMFKKYAEVETKIIKSNTKEKIGNEKHFNGTKLDLLYLDSKWFTNLVKSDGFKVRGHFRLQPKKHKGEWTKELIWINDFEKLGYTAPARKLSQSQ